MAEVRILENVTINQPVADLTALAAIPTGSLETNVVCFVESEHLFYKWNGSSWVIAFDISQYSTLASLDSSDLILVMRSGQYHNMTASVLPFLLDQSAL